MGDWYSLHLFNEDIFYSKVVPMLKSGEAYDEYSKSAVCQTPVEDLVHVASQFDPTFKIYPGFNGEDRSWGRDKPWTYDFARLFEMVVFTHCADYFPNIPLGKYPLPNRVDYKGGTVAGEIVDDLGKSNYSTIFCYEGGGITDWISAEDVQLLILDLDNIYADNFKKFVRLAAERNLGILAGVDLREDRSLPQYKFVEEDIVRDWGEGLIL